MWKGVRQRSMLNGPIWDIIIRKVVSYILGANGSNPSGHKRSAPMCTTTPSGYEIIIVRCERSWHLSTPSPISKKSPSRRILTNDNPNNTRSVNIYFYRVSTNVLTSNPPQEKKIMWIQPKRSSVYDIICITKTDKKNNEFGNRKF